MKKSYLLGAMMAATLSLSSAAYAGDQDFTIVNHTGMALDSMYVAPESDAKSWGSDLFDGKVLPSGNEVEIVFPASNQECDYAVNFKDSKGDEYEIHHVDLCTVRQLKLTMEGGALTYAAVK